MKSWLGRNRSRPTSSIALPSGSGDDWTPTWTRKIVNDAHTRRTLQIFRRALRMPYKECSLATIETFKISVPFWLSKENPRLQESLFGHQGLVDWNRIYHDSQNMLEPPHSLAPLQSELLQRMSGELVTNFSDPLPTHQIVFRIDGSKMRVSCYCRANPLKHSREKGGGDYYEPMPVGITESVYEAYNKPVNHFAPFSIGDMIRGN